MTNEEIFMKYVHNFDISCKSINRKINHSIRVSKICKKVAKSLNLDVELIELANFIGLVHNKYYDIILNAIKCHNEYILDCKLDEKSLIMTKILRDADKIDILYMVANGEIKIEKPSLNITQEVIFEFFQKKCINNKYLNTESDKILFRFALVFDLNYSFSLNYVLNNDYLNQMYKKLENNNLIEPYYEFVQKYLEEKCYGKI